MKVILVIVSSLLGLVQLAPVGHHFIPASRSTYHGVLGTFDVPPVYTPFAQTVIPYHQVAVPQINQVHLGYQGYQGYQSPVTYYTPGVNNLGGFVSFPSDPSYQIAGLQFVGPSFASPASTVIPQVPQIAHLVPTVPSVVPVAPEKLPTPETPAITSETPDSAAVDSQNPTDTSNQNESNEQVQDVANDNVNIDDDDTVTIEAS